MGTKSYSTMMPSVYVQKLPMLQQFVWLCGRDMDSSTSIMGVSNPGYEEYTIYGICTDQ